MSTNHRSGLISEGNYEVNFIKGNTLEHDVVLKFNPETDKGAIEGGKYYVMLDATSADGNNHYYYVVEVATDGSENPVYLPIEGTWSGNQPFSNNWRSIKATAITPKPGKTITAGGTQPNSNDYTTAYVFGDYKYTYIERKTETDTEQHIQRDEFIFELSKATYEDAIDPYDVLGSDGPEFGIIADRYEQYGHTETNMAVNSFKDEGGNIDLDGAGDAVMPFYVGSVDDGSKLWISQDTRVGVDLYITQDINDNHLQLTTTKPVEKYIKTESEINNYVNGLISTFTANSADLAGKKTIKPELSGNNTTLDLTQFPDNTTIYVDCTDMAGVIAGSGGAWHINKYPGQSIVFNMPGTGTVKVSEFYVHLFDKNGNETEEVKSTTSAMDGDPAHNKRVDEVIMEHITFNAYEASALDIDNCSGLFLAPHANRVTQSNGAGWIATGGTVESHAEWHFYRHQRRYKAKGDFSLSGRKKIMEGTTEKDYSEFSSMTFTFDLFECGADGKIAEGAKALETVTADSQGNFAFSKLKYTQEDVPEGQSKTFYYVVKEEVPTGDNDKGVNYDAAPVYVRVVATDEAGSETISFAISTRTKKSDGSWSEWKVIQVGGTDTDKVYGIGDFNNTYEEQKGSLKVKKIVNGDNAKSVSDRGQEQRGSLF